MKEKKSNIISASPKIRKFARALGADLSLVKGSERDGRVVEDDIRSFVKEKISEKKDIKKTIKEDKLDHSLFGEIDVQKIPRIKKIAGKHLTKSWNEIPHVTQHDEADITEMEEFRNSLRDMYTGQQIKITPLAFIIRALVKALKDFPNTNFNFRINK